MMDAWGANTFPVRKNNSRTFHLKVRRSRLFRFFRRFPQINVGGDSARFPFLKDVSVSLRVALPPKGRSRQLATLLGTFRELGRSVSVQCCYHDSFFIYVPFPFYPSLYLFVYNLLLYILVYNLCCDAMFGVFVYQLHS